MELNGNDILIDTNHHVVTKNPLRDDAFALNDDLKIELISEKFRDILDILGFDLNDDSIKDTPNRVAKMYIYEVFKGLNPKNRPALTLFKNDYKYDNPVFEVNIPFTSFCEHHFVPITGTANVAYIPKNHVIGLSKIHRLIDYYARRPQVQERLTRQVLNDLMNTLQTNDVGVVLKATHSCISCRGVEDKGSSTITSGFSGRIATDDSINSILYKE